MMETSELTIKGYLRKKDSKGHAIFTKDFDLSFSLTNEKGKMVQAIGEIIEDIAED